MSEHQPLSEKASAPAAGDVALTGSNGDAAPHSRQQPAAPHHPDATAGFGDRAQPSNVNHFDLAHGRSRHVKPSHAPLTWLHLFKKPVVRQWLVDSTLYKGTGQREATYIELFFDLMFVGIIHQLAEGAVEPVSKESVVRFILTFYPSWSIWSDVRNFINHSGTDDILQRIYILFNMLLLAGYSAMASSLELVPGGSGAEAAAEGVPASAEGGVTEAVARMLLRRAEPGAEHASSYHLVESFHRPLQAAIGFLLVAKLLRCVVYGIYAWMLPRFRVSMLLHAVLLTLPCWFWLPLIWTKSQHVVVALAATAAGVELGTRYVIGLVAKLDRKSAKIGGKNWLTPALSIEHMMERTGAFIVLVLGEIIINSTYAVSPEGHSIGLSSQYGRSAFSVIIAFELLWLYFDSDSSRAYVHALRRHWVTSIMNTQLIYPFSASLVLLSAATRELVLTYEVEQGIRWYFGGGISIALFVTALTGWLHLSLDAPNTSYLPRHVRLLLRVAVSIFFACLPLTHEIPNLEYLGIHAGALGLLIMAETIGKLGSQPADMMFNGYVPEGKGGKYSRWGHGIAKEDLTDAELGELDVGVEGELGEVVTRKIQPHQILAYTV